MRRISFVAASACAIAIALGGAGADRASAAPLPACSLPELTQDKLDEGARRVDLYRKRRQIEFSSKLQGFPPATKRPLTAREEEVLFVSRFFRLIFGLNRSPKLIRALIDASRRGSDRVVFIVGIPLTRLEKKIVSFTIFALSSSVRLDLYGSACAPGYGGYFFEGIGTGTGIGFAVRFKEDGDAHAEALRDHFALWPLLDFLGADYSLTELNQVNRQIGRDRDLLSKRGIRIIFRSISTELNAIEVFALARNPAGANRFFQSHYGDAVEAFVLPRDVFSFLRLRTKVRAERRFERRAQRLQARVARELRAGR